MLPGFQQMRRTTVIPPFQFNQFNQNHPFPLQRGRRLNDPPIYQPQIIPANPQIQPMQQDQYNQFNQLDQINQQTPQRKEKSLPPSPPKKTKQQTVTFAPKTFTIKKDPSFL